MSIRLKSILFGAPENPMRNLSLSTSDGMIVALL
nr:MAG TPA: hypothetical protein [Siphoviridae sp. ctJZ725]